MTGRKKPPYEALSWEAAGVRALRRHLGLSQEEMARELGIRQQTVSEWETGQYRPRGASVRLLGIIAERAGFEYSAGSESGNASMETRHRDPRP
ncbi:MAG TPA: helix-turn-helix domain-containing protein [Dehalococcoidia bacterium]|nr:helix-turn-helix domain-containing protein [Dehalococcoidia bacterium]